MSFSSRNSLHNGDLVLRRTPLALLAALTLLTSAAAGAADERAQASGATARAYGIRVLVPGQPEAGTPTLSAPHDAVLFTGGFNYNDLVTTGSANASVSAVSGSQASASAAAGYRGSVTVLEIRLTADHGGLPSGTTILVGYAEVAAKATAPPPPPTTVPEPPARTKKGPKRAAPAPAP